MIGNAANLVLLTALRLASAIPDGSWGGEHVTLEASEKGAALNFDCAHGSMPAPLTLGADGKFRIRGIFVREHGGPIRKGEARNSEDAVYSGTISGSKMTLSIELTRDHSLAGSFELELGSPGRLMKCR